MKDDELNEVIDRLISIGNRADVIGDAYNIDMALIYLRQAARDWSSHVG